MQVYITPRAERNFESIVDYIKQKWGAKTAKAFIQKVDEIFNLLKDYPLMGQAENNDIRGFQLSRLTRILYRIRDNKIIILSFFDVRQDPKKKSG
ncbi:MAG: type II toxin-antitoxin system RelE/ParE family toxin [Cyclobacteriaceae bacterium]|nr:type II toxin-antitoxin system RelE/ParE family toxin [Cyclobacteriaceae bacterium]